MESYKGPNAWYVAGTQPSEALTNGGGGQLPPSWRSVLDAKRMGIPRQPDAEYPDGYLGSVPSRRGDRMLNGLKVKLAQRPYSGIYSGVRSQPGDYVWPSHFNMATGLENQAKGKKFAPKGTPEEYLVNNGRRNLATPHEEKQMDQSNPNMSVSQYTSQRLRNLRPDWR